MIVLVFYILLVTPHLFALHTGFDAPVPKSAIKSRVKKWMRKAGDERGQNSTDVWHRLFVHAELCPVIGAGVVDVN